MLNCTYIVARENIYLKYEIVDVSPLMRPYNVFFYLRGDNTKVFFLLPYS